MYIEISTKEVELRGLRAKYQRSTQDTCGRLSRLASLFEFIDYLQDECKLGHGGHLGYIDAVSEMIDFIKLHGALEAVLREFSASELYLKRAQKRVAKMMRLQWTQDFDTGSKRSLGNNGGVVGGREISSAALGKYREDFSIKSSSS